MRAGRGGAILPRMIYDIGIVGASFAGLACARAAAHRGLRVLVIDRKPEPGASTRTTGLVVKEAAERWEIPAALTRRVAGIRLYSPSLAALDLDRAGYYFLATDTPALMRWPARGAASRAVSACASAAVTGATRITGGFAERHRPRARSRLSRRRRPALGRRARPRPRRQSRVPAGRGGRVRGRGRHRRAAPALLRRRRARAGIHRLGGAGL